VLGQKNATGITKSEDIAEHHGYLDSQKEYVKIVCPEKIYDLCSLK
jgi:hypothetical protein